MKLEPLDQLLRRVTSSSRFPRHLAGQEVPTIYDHVRTRLGVKFKGNKMPPDLSGSFVVDGVRITVLSATEKKSLTRIKATCPKCRKTFAAGRAGQHKCKHVLTCQYWVNGACLDKATHVDDRGFAYCTKHALPMMGGARVRKLTREEKKTLLNGGTIRTERINQ